MKAMERAYTLGLYEKAMPSDLTWREKLLAAKEAGFDFVEISIDETDAKLSRLDMTKEERLGLVRLIQETGVPIRTMCLSGHRKYPLGSSDPAVEARGIEIMEKRSGLRKTWESGSSSWQAMMYIMKNPHLRQRSVSLPI